MVSTRFIGLCFIAMVLVSPRRVLAQTIPPAALSLPDVLAMARSRAPDVVMLRHAATEARARRVGAGLIIPTNPRLAIEGRPPVTGGTLGDLGYGATLDVVAEVGGAPRARVREADRTVDLAEADVATERLRARSAAWQAYVRAKIAEVRVQQTEMLIVSAQRIVDASKLRVSVGAAGDIEQEVAALDLAELHAGLVEAQREHEARFSDLREAIDMPADQSIVLTTPLGEPESVPPSEELLRQALRARPELAQTRARRALLDATGERLRREVVPRVGGYIGVDAAPVSPIFAVVGVSVELPFAQRNQGPRAAVEAAYATEVDRLSLLTRRIEREVASIYEGYKMRRSQYTILRDVAVPKAERALGLVEAGWRSGRFDVFRVATTARDVARARGRLIDALEAAHLDRVALDRAVGGGL